MLRNIPEVRALYGRVRRPAISILVGLGLIAPLGFDILGPDTLESASAATPAGGEADRAGDKLAHVGSGSSGAATESSKASAVAAKEAKPASASTAPAKEVASTSPKSSAVARFARQYRIPVSLADQIYSAAVAEGIEPRIAFGLVQTESSFRRTVISSAGAVGYTQLLPSTANWIAPGTKRSDLFNTRTNLRVGFKYLNYLVDKYKGNMRLALTAYNRGPGTVDRLLKQGRNPENGYATKVLRAPRG